jgi:heme-degrading monooxygenase HmoA
MRQTEAADEPVTLINAFTVPPGESERFLQRWNDNARIMSGQPGFIGARMYCAFSEDAELRFINVAEWRSEKALAEARANPEFQASVGRLMSDPELHVTPRPAVYRVAVEVHPSNEL